MLLVPQITHTRQTEDGSQQVKLKVAGWCDIKTCKICGVEFFARVALQKFRPQTTCSHSCSRKLAWKEQREIMLAGSKKAGLAKKGMPAWNKGLATPPEVIAKTSAFRKTQRDSFLKVRGGNGTGMSTAEHLVSTLLPEGFIYNLPVKTLKKPVDGYPHCYKVDFGNPTSKIAIEVDGSSHSSLKRQAQDKKKDDLLRDLEWTVYRITNQQAATLSGISKSQVLTTISQMAK